MAVLKIHSDIVDEETRQMNLFWTGVDGTSFDSVDAFIESIPEDDNNIELRLNCRGGNCMEGWTIYDKLRSTGKEITAIIEGKCASMASILLLAAPKERRYAYQNATLLIHNPYIPPYTLADAYDAEDLRRMAEDLEVETTKIVNLYVDRTGSEEDVLRALMAEDKFVDMDKAKELGFISEVKSPISAKEKQPKKWNHSKINNMNQEKKVTVAQAFQMLGVALGVVKAPIVSLDLSTADGSTLTVEREDGEPQVGDTASPDGEHLMPDGSTIVVEGGVIAEIRDPEEENNNDELDAANARITELEAELTSLRAQAKSQDELVILNKVKTMGGLEGLKKIASSYVPDARGFQGNQGGQGGNSDPVSLIDKKLAEKRDARKKKFNR
ncbi:ATP-dependent Clp protease proteolytic subunit [Parabacteroides sp. BX2]|jgi:ATP-dependent protease ClpP protease subunit|uniref:ATP-dependent Clp protease proteolytic subunit n=1 Tax=Parabacteroides segnis TaxID=2763058 RepID=A0ABR7E4F3_9BACT|nr:MULTISPECIES: ATP-dependent Clp protease proteolytic subunit [Parabacteroides]MBC5644068.1 ATP-dependent Clp protease proteolytic subunit [Parabacteroides segnis]MCM0714228.1 ATP-dependent Clp protease proteolytic subunit [Parabacteroides sp. TA-V-105]